MNTVVSQALAMGLPVVATRHSGLPEQVVDGVNGWLVDEGDYRSLAEHIISIAENPHLLERYGVHGRAHVEERYNARLLIERQVEEYRRLAAGTGPRRA